MSLPALLCVRSLNRPSAAQSSFKKQSKMRYKFTVLTPYILIFFTVSRTFGMRFTIFSPVFPSFGRKIFSILVNFLQKPLYKRNLSCYNTQYQTRGGECNEGHLQCSRRYRRVDLRRRDYRSQRSLNQTATFHRVKGTTRPFRGVFLFYKKPGCVKGVARRKHGKPQ